MDDPKVAPSPYEAAGPKARYFKAILQMIIAAVAVPSVGVWVSIKAIHGASIGELGDGLFSGIGFALGAAAVIELAYTLYTDGPDEALDPLMLGISAALLIQLGRVDKFKTGEAIAAVLYSAALAGLFATRKWLADIEDPKSWSLVVALQERKHRRNPEREQPTAQPSRQTTADTGGSQAQVTEGQDHFDQRATIDS